MRFQAALTKEQGVTFAVVVVKRHVLNPGTRDDAKASFQPVFPGVPIVLMAQDGRGVPEYYGRPDIVRFLAKVPFEALPWREWSVAA